MIYNILAKMSASEWEIGLKNILLNSRGQPEYQSTYEINISQKGCLWNKVLKIAFALTGMIEFFYLSNPEEVLFGVCYKVTSAFRMTQFNSKKK